MARPRRHTTMPSDFPERAAKESTTALRKHYRVQLDRIVAWRLGCGVPSPMVRPAVNEGPPAGFAEAAAVNSSADLAKLYRRTAGTIAQWRRDCGVKAPGNSHVTAGTFQPVPTPQNFAALAPTMTRHEAEAFYGHGEAVLKRWASEAGVRFRKQISVVSGRRPPKVRDTARDMSRAGQAAEFLQKFGPVFRCTGTGAADPKGDHWRRGPKTLTAAEIIERAEAKGFDPDAWKRIAAPRHEGAPA